jgi:hypothetical protein
MLICGEKSMTSNEKTLKDIKLALDGNTAQTWNYIVKLLGKLGYYPPDGENRQSWAIATARRLME